MVRVRARRESCGDNRLVKAISFSFLKRSPTLPPSLYLSSPPALPLSETEYAQERGVLLRSLV
jgi:hypothetical protein